jgi:predicted nucleotidyltransferase
MLNLRPKDKEAICRIAKESFNSPIKILAYGSRVNGDSHDTSDLDLVIKPQGLKPVNLEEINRFREKLQDSTIPIIVQVMDWSRIPDSFKVNIQKRNEVLFSNYKGETAPKY